MRAGVDQGSRPMSRTAFGSSLDLMSATYEHPSLKMPVTPEQRDRAEQWLQEAYAEGRVSESEFDARIGQVISAGSRKELNEAFYGLVRPQFAPPAPSRGVQSMGVYGGGYVPAPRTESTTMGALAHFSGIFTWILGPGAVYLLSSPGSRTRREAAKAFNFQLIAGLALIIGSVLSVVAPWHILDFIVPLVWVGWLVLSVVGGAKAAQGADWKNPVKSVIKLDVMTER